MPFYFEAPPLLSEKGTQQNKIVLFFLLKQQTFPYTGKKSTVSSQAWHQLSAARWPEYGAGAHSC